MYNLDGNLAVLPHLHLANELDDPAPGIGIGHVLQGDFCNALCVYLLGIPMAAKGQAGQNAGAG